MLQFNEKERTKKKKKKKTIIGLGSPRSHHSPLD